LSWPPNVAGFDYTGYTLQSTTNLVSPVVWSTNSNPRGHHRRQEHVTNPIIGAQKFLPARPVSKEATHEIKTLNYCSYPR